MNIDHGVGVITKIKNDVKIYNIPELGAKEYDYYAENRKNLPIIEYKNFSTS